jgi:hypothetical protein
LLHTIWMAIAAAWFAPWLTNGRLVCPGGTTAAWMIASAPCRTTARPWAGEVLAAGGVLAEFLALTDETGAIDDSNKIVVGKGLMAASSRASTRGAPVPMRSPEFISLPAVIGRRPGESAECFGLLLTQLISPALPGFVKSSETRLSRTGSCWGHRCGNLRRGPDPRSLARLVRVQVRRRRRRGCHRRGRLGSNDGSGRRT